MDFELSPAVMITGHYGSGKTSLAVDLAVHFADMGERVCVIDMDIVNPYYRTADFSELFEKFGIKLVSPQYANTNLDIPALCFDMDALIDSYDRIIADVGGDDAGAIALGQYSAVLRKRGYDMIYVVNKYRLLTSTPEEALELLGDIELVSGLKATGIVNCSNLGAETTADIVLDSIPYAEECARITGLPLLFTSADERLGLDNCHKQEFFVNTFRGE